MPVLLTSRRRTRHAAAGPLSQGAAGRSSVPDVRRGGRVTRPGRPLTDAPAEPTVTRGVRLPESMAIDVDLVRGRESFAGWVRGAIAARLEANGTPLVPSNDTAAEETTDEAP